MNKLLFTKKMFLVNVFCLFGLTSSLDAQRNRYGMKLEEHNGVIQLVDQTQICEILIDSCSNLPKDIYTPLNDYSSKLIQPKDYINCTTQKYIFREYAEEGYVLNMEVDKPKMTTNKPYPFIIWVHGGGWVNGGVGAFENQSKYLASRGIAGVRITYSLQRQGGHFELGIEELELALQFVKNHGDQWGLDTSSYGWAGGSAGTPLSSLVAMQDNSSGCKVFIGYNGIYDFQDNRQGKFCGGKEIKSTYLENITDWQSISAINYISDNPDNIPAVILFHGTGDTTISHKQSEALCDAIVNKKGTAELHLYPYYAHAFFNQNISDAFEDITIKTYKFVANVFSLSGVDQH